MWDRLKYKLQNFMYGRNGNDDLNRLIFAVFVISYIVNLFVKSVVLSGIGTVLAILYIFRSFSRNLEARNRENEFLLDIVKFIRTKWRCRNTHKVYMCRCRTVVRVPKNRGKLEVTCPKCGRKKIIYTGKSS